MCICDRSVCTGCGLCAEVCPKGCIEMREDAVGHLYPHIDSKNCINCNLCKKMCPVINIPQQFPTYKAYAAWSHSSYDRTSSTSGGFASVVSRQIINDGGVVFGSALTSSGIEHIRVDNKSDLERLKGSKYVQSPIVNIYDDLEQDLKNGKKVLFIGTPCQAAAVRAYFNRFDNLYIIDLICTGVPPQKLLWEHLGFEKNKPQYIRFRDNTGSRLTVKDNNCIIYSKPVYNDYFFMGFSKHLYFRESCYNCPFATKNRASDITIGDFWGLGKRIPFEHDIKDGVSLVLPHNPKGEELIQNCRSELFLEERPLDEATESNPRYENPSCKHGSFERFRSIYTKKGFKSALKKSLRKERLRYFAYRNLRKIMRGGK